MSPGLRYMLVGAFFFSLMGLMVRLLNHLPFMEIVVVRGAVSGIICVSWMGFRGMSFFGKEKGLLFLRGILGFLGLSCYFYTLHEMPLAEAVTLQYLNPLFTAFFAPFVLKEKWSGREWIAGVLAFLGVIQIADPTVAGKWFPALVGLIGASCSGLAYNVVRKLGQTGEDPLTIVLYFPLVATFAGLPFAAVTWVTPTWMEGLLLLGVGLSTHIAQVALTHGLRRERAARATVMNYAVIFFSTLYGFFLKDHLPWNAVMGMACIVVALAVLASSGLSLTKSR